MTYGDLALDPCAQFLAIAEHRLIPVMARSVCHQLRRADCHSVWAPACQDRVASGHAGVGVVSLGGAPLSLPSFVTPLFQELFRLGRVLRTTLPTGKGGVVHLLLYMVIRRRRRMLISCGSLTSFFRLFLLKLRWFVLVKALLIAGDLNADPAVIPCLAKGIWISLLGVILGLGLLVLVVPCCLA